jgi:putative toxin-antitoxin system antitoxin component (TIGR02293 family)
MDLLTARDIVSELDPSGASTADWRALVEAVRHGLPIRALDATAKSLGLTREEAASALHLNPRTLYRRARSGARLSRGESEKVLRLARIGAHAMAVFEDQGKALRWLTRENRALGQVVPLSLLDSDVGAEAVNDELSRLEYGVLA